MAQTINLFSYYKGHWYVYANGRYWLYCNGRYYLYHNGKYYKDYNGKWYCVRLIFKDGSNDEAEEEEVDDDEEEDVDEEEEEEEMDMDMDQENDQADRSRAIEFAEGEICIAKELGWLDAYTGDLVQDAVSFFPLIIIMINELQVFYSKILQGLHISKKDKSY